MGLIGPFDAVLLPRWNEDVIAGAQNSDAGFAEEAQGG